MELAQSQDSSRPVRGRLIKTREIISTYETNYKPVRRGAPAGNRRRTPRWGEPRICLVLPRSPTIVLGDVASSTLPDRPKSARVN